MPDPELELAAKRPPCRTRAWTPPRTPIVSARRSRACRWISNRLQLALFSDHPYAEVARQLNLPLGTVKSRIRKGMIHMRRLLKSRAGGRA